ncbi:serine/threonine-protein kinase [Blastococcus sp. SYSU D00820]
MSADAGADGRLLGSRYVLAEVIGRGGMGVVWRATDRMLDRPVAVKEIVWPPHVTAHEREVLRERTLREARAAASLDDPHVTTVFDVVEEDGRPWLVMEHVPSRSLQQLVEEHGPLPWPAVARIGLDVLAGLSAAHAAGIVHRDVKPGNVLVASDGRAYLTDFGIATTTGDSSLTTAGTLIGSPSYMSPELAQGAAPAPPTDLWSLGVTLYTAVEGRPAFSRGDPVPTLMAVVSEHPPPAVLAGPLEPVLRGLLTKDPAQRLTAAQVREQLTALLPPDAAAPAWTPPATGMPPSPAPPHAGEAARGGQVVRLDADDLKTLAKASAAVLGSVARDARDQARYLAGRRRERKQEAASRPAAPPPAASRPTTARRDARRAAAPRRRRRFRRRWVVVPVVLVVLLLAAAVGGLLALLGLLF